MYFDSITPQHTQQLMKHPFLTVYISDAMLPFETKYAYRRRVLDKIIRRRKKGESKHNVQSK